MPKYKVPFYLNGIVIAILIITGYGALIGIPLLIVRVLKDKKAIRDAEGETARFEVYRKLIDLDAAIISKQDQISALDNKLSDRDKMIQEVIIQATEIANRKIEHINLEIASKDDLLQEIEDIKKKIKTYESKLSNAEFKLSSVHTTIKSFQHMIQSFSDKTDSEIGISIDADTIEFMESLSPVVTLKLHCMDMKDLRKAYKENQQLINEVLENYKNRYNTKANAAIYKLMVIALQAELQNVMYNMKFDRFENSQENVKKIAENYLKIAAEGNQSIAPTLVKFIGEIEYLFMNALKIEYEYYVLKEKAKEEQQRLKEIMRQEVEERKILEAQKKQIEAEEEKYHVEIDKLSDQLQATSPEDLKYQQLLEKIEELKGQLIAVEDKKEDIIKLQNGCAGYVYIISNLGSFGDDVFKIGMTRRLDPQDRVNELGDASVPFSFDVHSFIFSDDAVGLEGKMHDKLNDQRLNKINLRKEFFRSSIDDLEALVNELYPTAEFNKTMLAEQYRQSISVIEEDEEAAV